MESVRPILFQIGPISILSYGVILMLAMLMALFIVWRLYKNNLSFLRSRVTLDGFFDSVLVFVFSFGVGARLLHIFEHFNFFSGNIFRWLLFLHFPGFSLLGGIIGAIGGLWLYCRYQKQPNLLLLDIMVIGLSFTVAFSRIGSLLSGDSYGKETSFPLKVTLTGLPGFHHPTQLYEAILFFCIFAFLYFLYQRGRTKRGAIAVYFLFSVGFVRFFIEMVRGDSVYLRGIAVAQIISLLYVFVSAAILVFWKREELGRLSKECFLFAKNVFTKIPLRKP